MSDKVSDKSQPRDLCVVTGLSGAGKSTALRVFEDLRYFTVDSLPVSLAPEVEAIMRHESMRHFRGMAIGMDMRQENFLEEIRDALKKLSGPDVRGRLIFLEAGDEALFRRYATTRRPHPLERKGLGLDGAIAAERAMLKPVRDLADMIIDSTGYSIHDLRREITRHILKNDAASPRMKVNVVSFGYKYGIPPDADFLFDLRFLANPYFVEELRPLCGLDASVSEYVFGDAAAIDFRDKIMDLLQFTLARMEDEGRYRLTIAFGCTGGRHRSVAMAEEIARGLRQSDFPIVVEHRNLDNDLAGA